MEQNRSSEWARSYTGEVGRRIDWAPEGNRSLWRMRVASVDALSLAALTYTPALYKAAPDRLDYIAGVIALSLIMNFGIKYIAYFGARRNDI